MLTSASRDRIRLQAARRALEHVAEVVDARISIRLWDGTLVPLGRDVDPSFYVSVAGAGVIASLLRRPTLENVLRHYACGRIGFHGGDLMEFFDIARVRGSKSRLRGLRKGMLARQTLPFLFASASDVKASHQYASDETGRVDAKRDNKSFVQFHYDLGNDFYKLFLDPELQYSCGYFTDWNNTLEQAQRDKLDMICRKLRLKPGERLLDVGCGWGGLICHAARNYGVEAHGVTLSQAQHDFAQEKIRSLGLSDRVTVELRDYSTLEGTYDKIASIGMFEHIGIANFPTYFKKLYSLLRDRGLLLNHGIARAAKKSAKTFKRIRPENRWILKYIFPGSELDHIGHTLESMEACKLEVHDVEAWREHYAMTTRHWCRRLSARRSEAIELVGTERYNMWVAYLAGVSFAFHDGSLRIYQVVASKHASKGGSGLPPTRADLYGPASQPLERKRAS